jgi:hypothetical protein
MARWWACRSCDEVVPWLGRVRYSIGLTDHEQWLCGTCLEELERLAAQYAAGYAFAANDCVWAIEVSSEKGQRSVAVGAG